jgi:hypothetical protein
VFEASLSSPRGSGVIADPVGYIVNVPQALIDGAIAVAASVPSGANLQPW